jgi:hypothetical protein
MDSGIRAFLVDAMARNKKKNEIKNQQKITKIKRD